MTQQPDILCIGSVLWDIIGRAPGAMRLGSDVPGHITRIPGGVALNIAVTLAQFGLRPALLSAVGRDAEGTELLTACRAAGLITDLVHLSDALPTDSYMAIEDANGVIAAIADAHSLEQAGDAILAPMRDGRLPAPYTGAIALDGNLTLELLTLIAQDDLFAEADLRVAPASPGKADRLQPFLQTGRGTLYVNLEEAGLLCHAEQHSAPQPAEALLARGAGRVLVTDGARAASLGDSSGILTQTPPQVRIARLTGAGDTFMAAHIRADLAGQAPDEALSQALHAAATFVSGETPQ